MPLTQLALDGGEVAYPLRRPRRLTERQRELLRFVRMWTEHGGQMGTHEARAFYADATGALRRLEALGLVRRVARGFWTAT